MNKAKVSSCLSTSERLFQTPERFLRLCFRKLSGLISRYPVTVLVVYLSAVLVVCLSSFLLVQIEWVDVYSAYQPKQFQSYDELVSKIDRKWAEYNKEGNTGKQTPDRVQLLFYDIPVESNGDKMRLISGIHKVCTLVGSLSITSSVDGSSVGFHQMQFNFDNDNSTSHEPQECQLVQRFFGLQNANSQQIILVSFLNFLTFSKLRFRKRNAKNFEVRDY